MHKRVLGYLLAIVLLLTPSISVFADSYDVTAKVPAPLPANEVPVVTTPGDNTVFTSQSATIVGTCPVVVPALIVVLERDSQTIGSGSCNTNGTFSIVVGLVLGANTIRPKFMTITGESSGYGTVLNLVYRFADQPIKSPNEAKPQTNTTEEQKKPELAGALAIVFDYDFVTYTTQQTTNIKLQINGGKSPYVLLVEWGDGSYKKYEIKDSGPLTLAHRYRSVLAEPMKLKLSVTDASGAKAQTERALVSFEKPHTNTPAAQPAELDKNYAAFWALSSTGILAIVSINYKKLYMHRDVRKKKPLKRTSKSSNMRTKK